MTRKEKETIDSGYAHLEYVAQFILGAESDLKDALRSEKRERSTTQAAKALLVSSFLDGFGDPAFPASDLFHRATGLAYATMLGAAAKVRGVTLKRPGGHARCGGCSRTHAGPKACSFEGGDTMKPIKLTRELARAASEDAANRAMRKEGRTTWTQEDYSIAIAEFNRLWPIHLDCHPDDVMRDGDF